jgi:hypothetical protein
VGLKATWERFIGRLFSRPKKCFVTVGELLKFPHELLTRMRASSDEECEELLILGVENGHGGVLDWKADLGDVLEALDPVLTLEERVAFRKIDDAESPKFPEIIHLLDNKLRPPMRALRAVGGLGDSYILFLAPRDGLLEFDTAAACWLI